MVATTARQVHVQGHTGHNELRGLRQVSFRVVASCVVAALAVLSMSWTVALNGIYLGQPTSSATSVLDSRGQTFVVTDISSVGKRIVVFEGPIYFTGGPEIASKWLPAMRTDRSELILAYADDISWIDENRFDVVCRMEYGWPIPCFVARFGLNEVGMTNTYAIVNSSHARMAQSRPIDYRQWQEIRAIPLDPKWMGAILSTLVVASIILGMLFSRDMLIALRRRLRLQCMNCGYDLQGSPQKCPECGRVNAPGK